MARSAAQERWLRFYNEIVYQSFPYVYDALDWLTFGSWWNLVRRALYHVSPGGQVLEIGFGTGRLQIELSRQADLCLGLDLAWGMCLFTRRRLERVGLSSGLVQGSVFALPYPSNTFDTVVSTFALSGIPDGALVMSEIARVMIAGGRFVLVDIGFPKDNNRLGLFFAHLWEHMGDFIYDQPQLMKDAGLEVVIFEETGPGDHVRVVVGQKRAIASSQ